MLPIPFPSSQHLLYNEAKYRKIYGEEVLRGEHERLLNGAYWSRVTVQSCGDWQDHKKRKEKKRKRR